MKGETSVVQVPGQRQSISAASAVSDKGAFWFASYKGALTREFLVDLLKKLMCRRRKALHLVFGGRQSRALEDGQHFQGLCLCAICSFTPSRLVTHERPFLDTDIPELSAPLFASHATSISGPGTIS